MKTTMKTGLPGKLKHVFNVRSLRLRLLLGFLWVGLSTLGIAAAGVWYQSHTQSLSELRSQATQILLEVTRMQQAEAEFNSVGVVDSTFFKTGSHFALEDWDSSNLRLVQALDGLETALDGSGGSGAALREQVGYMRSDAEMLKERFCIYQQLVFSRGFVSYGIMGAMRGDAHRLEEEGRLDPLQLLQLRRHEKDYLLRQDREYYQKAQALGGALLAEAEGRGWEFESRLLTSYLDGFRKLVELDQRIGITSPFGLRQGIRQASLALGAGVEGISDDIDRQARAAALGARWVFAAIALAGLCMGIVVALRFAAKLSSPIRNITSFIRFEIDSKFQTDTSLLHVTGGDEFHGLADDVNAMVQQIRSQLQEIFEQSRMLLEKNKALKEVNEQLQVTQARQAAMLATRERLHSILSHDLRAPLNGLGAYLQLLIEDGDTMDSQQTKRFAIQMQATVARLSEMLESLLRWSMFRSGDLKPTLQWLPLRATLAQNVALYADIALQKGISIQVLDFDDCNVYGDKEMLDFVLRNLLSNAIKFSHPGTTVCVGVTQSLGEKLKVFVADEGMGMSAAQLARLTSKGVATSMAGTQQESGTGLGLMLCRDFVAHMGGKLHIKSAPGKGTKVSFRLPHDDEGEADAVASPSNASYGLGK